MGDRKEKDAGSKILSATRNPQYEIPDNLSARQRDFPLFKLAKRFVAYEITNIEN
jgi:hypothetical protein